MISSKEIDSLFDDEVKEEKDKSKKDKKMKIKKKGKVKLPDLKNIIITGAAALSCYNGLYRFAPSSIAYGGPVTLGITGALAAFELWSTIQIRKSGQEISKKHSIKKCKTSSGKGMDNAIFIAQLTLYLATVLLNLPLGLTAAPAVIFGAMGIVAKLSQMITNTKKEEKGKEK